MTRTEQKIQTIIMFIFAIIFIACDHQQEKVFVWQDDIAKLTERDLSSWLRRAPFNNELKLREDDKVVFTNADQVFPFMARYYNDVQEIKPTYSSTDTLIYQQEHVLYQDPDWGDLFVSATLLYGDEEVFLNNSYSELGNPMFDGADAVMHTSTSSLEETDVYSNNKHYKTAIYWAEANMKSYLLGFYQRGQFVFEAAVPLIQVDSLASIKKLQEINKKLGLAIPEWEAANLINIRPTRENLTFWKDPFVGLYLSQQALLDEVHLKLKDTPFVAADTASPKGDYYYAYNSANGPVELYTNITTDKAYQNESAFNEAHAAGSSYSTGLQTIFYTEQTENGRTKGLAKGYLTASRILELHYSFPEDNQQAKAEIHDILSHIRTTKF